MPAMSMLRSAMVRPCFQAASRCLRGVASLGHGVDDFLAAVHAVAAREDLGVAGGAGRRIGHDAAASVESHPRELLGDATELGLADGEGHEIARKLHLACRQMETFDRARPTHARRRAGWRPAWPAGRQTHPVLARPRHLVRVAAHVLDGRAGTPSSRCGRPELARTRARRRWPCCPRPRRQRARASPPSPAGELHLLDPRRGPHDARSVLARDPELCCPHRGRGPGTPRRARPGAAPRSRPCPTSTPQSHLDAQRRDPLDLGERRRRRAACTARRRSCSGRPAARASRRRPAWCPSSARYAGERERRGTGPDARDALARLGRPGLRHAVAPAPGASPSPWRSAGAARWRWAFAARPRRRTSPRTAPRPGIRASTTCPRMFCSKMVRALPRTLPLAIRLMKPGTSMLGRARPGARRVGAVEAPLGLEPRLGLASSGGFLSSSALSAGASVGSCFEERGPLMLRR